MEFIFQTTNGLCIGIGKNTTPVAKKNALESRTVFYLEACLQRQVSPVS